MRSWVWQQRRILVAVGLVLPAVAPRAATAGPFSGHSFGAVVHIAAIDTTVCDSGELPSTGGSLTTILQDVRVGSVLTAGAMLAQTYSSSAVISEANTGGLSVLAGTPAALTADEVPSTAIALCGGAAAQLGITNLVFAGVPIHVTGQNQTVVLPGIATLIINEIVESIT